MLRRDGIPNPQIGVVDTFLRVLGIAKDIACHRAAYCAVFAIQLRKRLLGTREKQCDDLVVLHWVITSFCLTHVLPF